MWFIMSSFNLTRLVDYTDDEMLAELRRVATLIPDTVITRAAFAKHSRVSYSAVIRRFGSWQHALIKADLMHRYSGRSVTGKMKSQCAKSMSDEDILNELRSVAKKVERNDITVEEFNEYSTIGAHSVRRRFGSWQAGVLQAGLSVRSHGRRYSDEECFENLLGVWIHYGRPPRYGEMNLPPSTVGSKAYIVRWKKWNHALHAFVERVKREDEGSSAKISPISLVVQPQESPKSRLEEDRHKIKLGLRYRVLSRDRFKCVLCGSSPATELACRLHVDHVIPWSKGGKTLMENLRTLCEACNLGKGDEVATRTAD